MGICKRTNGTTVPFRAHSVQKDDDDDSDDEENYPIGAPGSAEMGSPDAAIPWTRAFGDLDFKLPGSSPRLSVTPDTVVHYLDPQDRGVALVCRALYNAIGRENAVTTVFKRSRGRPRMASGAMVDAA